MISGIGGSGKSIFLKHLFILSKREKFGKIPFYVELRNVKSKPLIDYLADLLINIRSTIGKESFVYALNTGKFLFLFDGLDEVDTDYREQLVTDLHDLVYKYDDNIFVVTSRPDLNLSAWNEFYEAKIRGFSMDQVVSLINRIDYDVDLKSRFVRAIESGLYDSHYSYLSNPLLCLIMLMTYEGGAGIPESLHLFFSQAFDVLFYRHDATKGDSYQRKFKSNLNIDEFRNVMSGFSFFSYFGSGSSMTNEEAVESARQSIKFFEKSCSEQDFLHDLTKSLSLVIKDAEKYYYIHRTFQEYFVAYFLSKQNFTGWADVVDGIGIRNFNENIIPMMLEMDRDRFDRFYLKEKLEELLRKIKRLGNNNARIIELFFTALDVKNTRCLAMMLSNKNNYPLIRILQADRSSPLGRGDCLAGDWTSIIAAAKSSGSLGEAGHDSPASFHIVPSKFSAALVNSSPIRAYVDAIKVSIKERLQQIEEREENKRGLMATHIMNKLRSPKRNAPV